MKTFFLALISFLMINQALALSAKEFAESFIAQVNHRLSFTNKERIEGEKTPYCEKLNKFQERLILKTAEKARVTVGEFATTVSEKLHCYPEFWSPWGRKNIGGVMLNTKAFIMDTFLVRSTIEDLGKRTPNDEERLLEYIDLW